MNASQSEKPTSVDRFDFPLRTEHPYIMYDNLRDIPRVLGLCLEDDSLSQIRTFASEITRRNITKIYFVGCGTSLNEGRTVSPCFERYAKLPTRAIDSLEFTLHPVPDLDEKTCVILISHSGNSITTVNAATFAREKGAYTIGMVGRPDGRLATACEVVLFDPGGRELNGPKMRSYIVTCFQGLLLSLALNELSTDKNYISELFEVPARYASYLNEVEPKAKSLANEWGPEISTYLAAGSGCDSGNAYEVALKLLETIFVPSLGFDIEELTHGPLYCLRPDRAVILLQSTLAGKYRFLEAAYAISAVTKHIMVVTEDPEADWPESAHIFALPEDLGTAAFLFSPLPAQLMCYYLCLTLGTHPDRSSAFDPALQEMSSRSFPPGTH